MKKLWQNLKTEKKKIVTECLPLKLPQDSPKSTKQSNCKSFVSLDPSCIPFIDGDTACSEDSEGASGCKYNSIIQLIATQKKSFEAFHASH